LVVDLLAQPAAVRGGLSPDSQCAATAAAARPSAQARHTWRRAHGGRRRRADARTDLGRAALWLGIRADTRALRRLGCAVGLFRLARDDRAGAVHSSVGPARRG